MTLTVVDEDRYSIEPLMEMFRVVEWPSASGDQIRRHFGIRVQKWKRIVADGMTYDEADRYACALGYHPRSIWPEWR